MYQILFKIFPRQIMYDSTMEMQITPIVTKSVYIHFTTSRLQKLVSVGSHQEIMIPSTSSFSRSFPVDNNLELVVWLDHLIFNEYYYPSPLIWFPAKRSWTQKLAKFVCLIGLFWSILNPNTLYTIFCVISISTKRNKKEVLGNWIVDTFDCAWWNITTSILKFFFYWSYFVKKNHAWYHVTV